MLDTYRWINEFIFAPNTLFMISIDEHLAEVVVVAEVEVPRGVGGPLVLRDHLQHRQRVEYPRQEDDPHV